MACARFLVTGSVQGVFFRASTREQALRLGISGRATNLANGGVEVIACGDDPALARLERWLQEGPPAVRVQSVSRQPLPDQAFRGFETR